MKTIASASILLIIIFFSACKKDDVSPTASDKTTFLTNGTWKLTAVVSDEDGNATYETDDYATFSPCFTDNILIFKPDFQIVLDEGPSKCDPRDTQTITGTWALLNNENDLKINTDVWVIVELTNSILRWREDGPGNTSSIVTLTKR